MLDEALRHLISEGVVRFGPRRFVPGVSNHPVRHRLVSGDALRLVRRIRDGVGLDC